MMGVSDKRMGEQGDKGGIKGGRRCLRAWGGEHNAGK